MIKYLVILTGISLCSIILIIYLIAKNSVYRETFKELINAKKQAEEGSRAKGDFLSNMSHEIRTPLNAIIGMTSIGKTAADSEQKDHSFAKIEDASKHLLGVVNEILDISKIEANKMELSSVDFEFDKMIEKAVNVIQFRMEEKHQKFSVFIDKNIPERLIGDDQRIAQVITNLLSNAVKFTPEKGAIRLDAHLLREQSKIYTIKFSVSDTGIGISKEQQEKLFQSFQQANSNTSREFGGTGLGLAISKRIVEMMGGKVGLKSELGKGAVFFFTIQAERGKTNSQNADPEQNELQGGINNIFSGCHVLLAEDVEINREIVTVLLEPTGLVIDYAENGETALRMYKENPEYYDIIFMDVQMPVMDGLEATRRIRAFETKYYAKKNALEFASETDYPKESSRQWIHPQGVPIVAMTANVFREDILKCLEAGMDDHIGKPLGLETVLGKLRNYLPMGGKDPVMTAVFQSAHR